MFCVFLHFLRSVLVSLAISSSDSRERHFFRLIIAQIDSSLGKYTSDQPRFQANIPSNRT